MKDLIKKSTEIIDNDFIINISYFDYNLMQMQNKKLIINNNMLYKELEEVFSIIDNVNINNIKDTTEDNMDLINFLDYIEGLNLYNQTSLNRLERNFIYNDLNKFRKQTLKTMIIYINNKIFRDFIDHYLKDSKYINKIIYLNFYHDFSKKDVKILNKILDLDLLSSSVMRIYNSDLKYDDKELIVNVISYLETYNNISEIDIVYLDKYLQELFIILENTEYTLNEILVENIRYKLLYRGFSKLSLVSLNHLQKISKELRRDNIEYNK